MRILTLPRQGLSVENCTITKWHKQPGDVTPGTPQQAESGGGYTELPISNIRKIIANTMRESLLNSAQLTNNSSFDATGIIEFRKKLKENGGKLGLPKVSVTDIIIFVTSRVLLKHKIANAHVITDDTGAGRLLLFNDVNMGLATDTPRGLMVPTIFGANRMSLAEISTAAKEVAGACRAGTISPDLLKGGTFTISNLGTFGVESFTPVLNPPQTCLLGVCNIAERTKNGRFYPAMGLSLTYDHRAMDGADAGRLLMDIVSALENFSLFAAINGS